MGFRKRLIEVSVLESSLSFLILVVPKFWLPQFDLVSIGINDPKERAVLVILWSLMDRNASGIKLRDHFVHIVDSIVDHEGCFTRTEPF